MNLPVRRDDEDARKLALAPEGGPRYLQHDDGSWDLVGEDGWLIDPEELRDLHADATAVNAAATFAPIDVDLLTEVRQGLLSMPSVIDVEPISVRDNEVR
ncbi:hypothetical protein OG874_37610 [Nocardia sp. NBC_00565]|uniref:hypothetical protein n=1 Tax=Nocardia sp. NBC_00565 TaxID=2975993 RepID=UPI002E821941|nr:hypothetical protein [Nocardia sp. NBC_00565]WUC02384.1 hypothetical protein OG874_37610 [Nocardia sp. NBC_00565]